MLLHFLGIFLAGEMDDWIFRLCDALTGGVSGVLGWAGTSGKGGDCGGIESGEDRDGGGSGGVPES